MFRIFVLRLANHHHQPLQWVSSTDRKSLRSRLKKHRNSFIIISNVHLIKDFLLKIPVRWSLIVICICPSSLQDEIRSTFENQLCFLSDHQYRKEIPRQMKRIVWTVCRNLCSSIVQIGWKINVSSSLSPVSVHHLSHLLFFSRTISILSEMDWISSFPFIHILFGKRFSPRIRRSHSRRSSLCSSSRSFFLWNLTEKDLQMSVDEYVQRSSKKSLLDYSNLIPSEGQQTFLRHLEQVIRSGRQICSTCLLLLFFFLIRVLIHWRSIYPSPSPQSPFLIINGRSLFDGRIGINLLENFVLFNGSILQTNSVLHSMISPRHSQIDDFIANSGLAFESLSKSSSTKINWRFLRRRQCLRFISLDQQRQNEDDEEKNLFFQVGAWNLVSPSLLTIAFLQIWMNSPIDPNGKYLLEGFYLVIDDDDKPIGILFRENPSSAPRALPVLRLDENSSPNKSSFLSICHAERIPSSLLLLSLERPHF